MKKHLAILAIAMAGFLDVSGQLPADSLSLWLRADSGVTVLGTDVTQWDDLSGNARHATTISPAYPQLIPNELCNKPVIRFNGGSTYMVTPAFQTFANMRGTIFVVVRVNGAGNGAGGYGTFVSIFMPGEWQFGSYSTSSYAFYDGSGGSNIPFATSPPSQWGILALNRKYDDTISFYKSGALAVNDDIAILQPTPQTFKIGSRGDAYEVLNGDIAEIIVYDRSLNEAEMYQVNTYLANRYCFNSNVAVPLASGDSRCGAGQDTLTASGAVHYRWYDGPFSSNILDTNAVFITPLLTATDTFYVANYNDTLESPRIAVVAVVLPLPSVGFSLPAFQDSVCLADAAFLLSGGLPSGGIYSGSGVSGGQFDPNLAGPGAAQLQYSYTDSNGCSGAAAQQIWVDLCLGLEHPLQQAISIWPNPADDQLHIGMSEQVVAAYCNTITGQRVPLRIDNQLIDVSLLPVGAYFLELHTDSGLVLHKCFLKK